MKKLLILVTAYFIVTHIFSSAYAGKLTVTSGKQELKKENKYKKAYFAGGCFWCMEESFDQVGGVVSVVSGYSGGHIKNPTYADVVYTDSGHVEAIEVTYNPKLITYTKLLDAYWQNIDPFDSLGQFCDKGKSYRSVIFFQNEKQKNLIEVSFKKIEKMFSKKIVTLVWEFEKFYKAEKFHQDYYEKNFVRYLMYKKSCQREETLEKIWN